MRFKLRSFLYKPDFVIDYIKSLGIKVVFKYCKKRQF